MGSGDHAAVTSQAEWEWWVLFTSHVHTPLFQGCLVFLGGLREEEGSFLYTVTPDKGEGGKPSLAWSSITEYPDQGFDFPLWEPPSTPLPPGYSENSSRGKSYLWGVTGWGSV